VVEDVGVDVDYVASAFSIVVLWTITGGETALRISIHNYHSFLQHFTGHFKFSKFSFIFFIIAALNLH
jgi:hypothetical protein